jgi:hypothetical protein
MICSIVCLDDGCILLGVCSIVNKKFRVYLAFICTTEHRVEIDCNEGNYAVVCDLSHGIEMSGVKSVCLWYKMMCPSRQQYSGSRSSRSIYGVYWVMGFVSSMKSNSLVLRGCAGGGLNF